MRNLRSWFNSLVVAGFLLGSTAAVPVVQAQQGPFVHGAVVALQGTPHLWIADPQGVLHWAGDTRALAGKHVDWGRRVEATLAQLQTFTRGDPWLSAGLLKDGDPIYLVKWEGAWPEPRLLHIQSIGDVELFGINGSNYGNFVLERAAWELRFGISVAGLQRSTLAAATAPPTSVPAPPTATPFPPGDPALFSAIWRGQTGTVRVLVAAGARVNVVDDDGDPFLHEAIWRGHTEIVRILVDAGADVNAKDSRGRSMLQEAVFRGHTEIVQILAAAGAQSTYAIDALAADSPDRAALVALYNATDGANWRNKQNWLSEAPIRAWYGVATDRNGRVTGLFLPGNQLRGTIPAELGRLTNLKRLYLYENQLRGTIPAELGHLRNLEYLALHHNRLSGGIPSTFSGLTNLIGMSIWTGNQLIELLPDPLVVIPEGVEVVTEGVGGIAEGTVGVVEGILGVFGW